MSFGGCLGPMPEVALGVGAVLGLVFGAIPAGVEIAKRRAAPGDATAIAAGVVFLALGAVPWAPAWLALWQRHALAETVAWWTSVIAFGMAAALLRRRWPSLTLAVYAAAIAVGWWQGKGFADTAMSSSCTGNDPVYGGVAFALGTLVPWALAVKFAARFGEPDRA